MIEPVTVSVAVAGGDKSHSVGKRVNAIIASDELIISGDSRSRTAVTLGEMHRARVAGSRIVKLILRANGHTNGVPAVALAGALTTQMRLVAALMGRLLLFPPP